MIALTRPVSLSLAACELTHLAREPIDIPRATAQHGAYERVLRSLGATIARVPAAPESPDAVFIEDTAIVLDEVAVITRPGAAVRRGETSPVAAILGGYRPLLSIESPATIDGGDVLTLGRVLYVGRSSRTSDEGIAQLRRLLAPFDYHVEPVELAGCLHLKSAVTSPADGLLLLNPEWVAPDQFPGYEAMTIDPSEPYAANTIRIGGALVCAAAYPRTLDALSGRGFDIETVDCSELAKAEGALTCCSLIFEATVA